MTRAAVYCRISLDRDGQGLGVERQREDCLDIARSNGWQVPDSALYIDNDVSASEFSRKARANYLRLLADIQAGHYDAVILWMEDRGHRQVIEAGEFVKLCQAHGVHKLVIASEETTYNLADPLEVANFYGRVVEAQKEAAKLSVRSRRKRRQMAEAGQDHRGGRRPFGFRGQVRRRDDATGGWVTEPAITLAQALSEQECIRDAAARVLRGESLRSICADWSSRRDPITGEPTPIRTPYGNRWDPKTLKGMLTSPRVGGYRTHHGRLIATDQWQPILPREQWHELRAVLLDPSRDTRKGGRPFAYLLSGLVVCGACGHTLKHEQHRKYGGGYRRVYQCKGRLPGDGCGKVLRAAEPVERYIERALFLAVESPEWDRQMASSGEAADDAAAPLRDELALYRARLARWVEKFRDDLISTDEYKLGRAQLEAQIETATSALARLRGNRVVAQIPRNVREVWAELPLDRRRAIVAAVFTRIEILPVTKPGSRTFDPDAVRFITAAE